MEKKLEVSYEEGMDGWMDGGVEKTPKGGLVIVL